MNFADIQNELYDFFALDLFFGNPLSSWIRVTIIFLVLFFSFGFVKVFASRNYKKLKSRDPYILDWKLIATSLLRKLNFYAVLLFSLYPAIYKFTMPPRAGKIVKMLFIVSVFAQLAIWAMNLVDLYYRNQAMKTIDKPGAITAINVFTLIWKILAVTLLVLMMLDQLGVNITAMLAGLGVGGIAVAFALQNVLGDIFGSLAIIMDQPFKVGDTIKIDNMTGVVEKVGFKTTRIRSIDGEELVFSNNALLNATIQNYYGIKERRILFKIGVEYSTPYDKLKKTPDVLTKAITTVEGTRVERVHFREFADSSLNFEVGFYIDERANRSFLDAQHSVNLEIVRAFEQEGISFAFPTRTIHVKNEASP